ncbi:MAG: recombinase RecA [SAR324 cluster bacterium]|nr:recombinase RecA [SAR324 cluster bacterium]
MANTADKDKALENALIQIDKQYGKGSIMRLGKQGAPDMPVLSTGNLALDKALAIGGLPKGRIIEVYGPESSGKTTLCLHVIAEAQKSGGTVAFIDAEHALDTGYAKRVGVDTEKLLLSQPDYGEQALEITDILVRSQSIDLIVIDSVAALTPKAEISGDMGDSHMGLHARLMSQALRKLTGSIAKSQSMVIFINQLRHKIGIMFGNPETTTGGNALKFYSSVRLDIRRISSIKSGDKFLGNRVRVKVVKNKLAPPFTSAEIDLNFGEGLSKTGSILDLAVQEDIIKKSGSWFSYEDEKIGQGRDSAKKFLKDNPKIYDKIDLTLRQLYGMIKGPKGNKETVNAPKVDKKIVEPQSKSKGDGGQKPGV